MPVCGKHEKAMKLLPFPPPLEIAAAISHIPTASTTTGYICLQVPPVKRYGGEGTVKHLPGQLIEW
jgi:hypothetical protein